MKLNAEQRVFAEENHNFIYWFLQKKGFDQEEYYDIAAIGYIKAVQAYKPGMATFATYSATCMLNQILMDKRKKRVPTLSLNYILETDEGKAEYGDYVADPYDLSSELESEVDIEALLSSLPEKTQKIVRMRSQELTQREIAENMQMSQAQICRLIQDSKKVLLAR